MRPRSAVPLAAFVAAAAITACEAFAPTTNQPERAETPGALYSNPGFCTKCHGGVDNGTGAPPYDLAGNSATVLPAVGAHSSHVEGGAIAAPLGCVQCHPQTAGICTPTHIDATVDLSFGPIATSHGVAATYVGGSCTTWCHGATMTGGTNGQPIWTAVGQGQAACGACHGIPPVLPSPNHPAVVQGVRCRECHPDTMTVDYLNRDVLKPNGGNGAHVNGVVEAFGHAAGWYDPASPFGGTHGANVWNGAGTLWMEDYYAQCTTCHGSRSGWDFTVSGGWTGVSCGACHAAFFVTEQPVGDRCGGYTTVPCTSCLFCH